MRNLTEKTVGYASAQGLGLTKVMIATGVFGTIAWCAVATYVLLDLLF